MEQVTHSSSQVATPATPAVQQSQGEGSDCRIGKGIAGLKCY